MKQMELVYNQEYQLQLLERKISRAQGERSNEEKAALAAKIASLTSDLDSETQNASLLAAQLKKIEDDVKAVRRKVGREGWERERERERESETSGRTRRRPRSQRRSPHSPQTSTPRRRTRRSSPRS